jgi:glucose/arabinose dehydrogenase
VLAPLLMCLVATPTLIAPIAVAQEQEEGEDEHPPPEEEGGPVAGQRPSPIPRDAPSVALQRIAGGLTVPVFLTQPDDDTGRLFIVDQAGQIVIVENGTLLDDPFLDLSDRIVRLDPGYDERGVLGLAFHPEYRDNGRFFVYYSAPLRDEAPEDWDHTSHLSEFRVSPDDPNIADPDSERIVMEIDQPQGNHNAGHIGFGLDGYLYVPLGDGGDCCDTGPGHPPLGNGQDITTLLGSVLRIDVDNGDPYAIPDDNPFANGDVDLPEDEPFANDSVPPEIWAYGLRNPYALSFDLETGEAYTADAGQAMMEEANRLEAGGNFGWNILEGTICFNPDRVVTPPEDCPREGPLGEELIDPIVEYERGPEAGSVIVAAVRYRGQAMPEYEGVLFLADYSRIRYEPDGILYIARPQEEGPWAPELLRIDTRLDGRSEGLLRRFVLTISQDLDGELYLLTTRRGGPTGTSGEVFAIRSAEGEAPIRGVVDETMLAWWVAAGAAIVLLALAGVYLAMRRRDRGNAPAR